MLRPPAQVGRAAAAGIHAELSTRERVALQTQPEACQGCHAMINPLGFTLENFDAIGRYRESDKNHPIDATGSYLTQSGEVKKFKGVKDLAAFLAASEESQDAFVKQLFHHTVKQPIRPMARTGCTNCSNRSPKTTTISKSCWSKSSPTARRQVK